MKQIFILGASSVYGVGGADGGWADMVKRYYHHRMFDEGGMGEKFEVYNFAKSGATIEFIEQTFPQQFKDYGRGQEAAIFLSIGGNDAKAEGEPDRFVSTPEDFGEKAKRLLVSLKEAAGQVVVVSNGYVDEAKTNPKSNPLTGSRSYFTNERRQLFNQTTAGVCRELGIPFVGIVPDIAEWQEKYLYRDGLHPNQAGHELIYASLKQYLD
ncbi:MAG TPA: GDSL-type esterase/lipase family protein [Candidatus Saccharimonadia bacterium]|jgi:lysophospholipase L1-like esterase|nr:GDSL-type esterase/lipase family protein [Candidatus Saccharimonadia bacterium]